MRALNTPSPVVRSSGTVRRVRSLARWEGGGVDVPASSTPMPERSANREDAAVGCVVVGAAVAMVAAGADPSEMTSPGCRWDAAAEEVAPSRVLVPIGVTAGMVVVEMSSVRGATIGSARLGPSDGGAAAGAGAGVLSMPVSGVSSLTAGAAGVAPVAGAEESVGAAGVAGAAGWAGSVAAGVVTGLGVVSGAGVAGVVSGAGVAGVVVGSVPTGASIPGPGR